MRVSRHDNKYPCKNNLLNKHKCLSFISHIHCCACIKRQLVPSSTPSISPSEAGDTGGVTLPPTRAPVPRRPAGGVTLAPTRAPVPRRPVADTSIVPSQTPSSLTTNSIHPSTQPSVTPSKSQLPSSEPNEVPSMSPTDCNDNESYVSPINKAYGCALYNSTNCDCYTFKNMMTPEEFQDVFKSCPKTCGVPCDYRPVSPSFSPSVSMQPTARRSEQPSFEPSRKPSDSVNPSQGPTIGSSIEPSAPPSNLSSLSPSIRASLQPSQVPSNGCVDNPDYESPINCNLGCNLHVGAEIDCYSWIDILDLQQTQDLLTNCPRACGICG